MSKVGGLLNNSYKPITNTAWVLARLCKLQKECTRLAAQVIKFISCLLMVGGSLRVLRLFSTTKTGRHDIAEILLKVAFNTINLNQPRSFRIHVHAIKRSI